MMTGGFAYAHTKTVTPVTKVFNTNTRRSGGSWASPVVLNSAASCRQLPRSCRCSRHRAIPLECLQKAGNTFTITSSKSPVRAIYVMQQETHWTSCSFHRAQTPISLGPATPKPGLALRVYFKVSQSHTVVTSTTSKVVTFVLLI